jgi:Protein phosphatase 2C
MTQRVRPRLRQFTVAHDPNHPERNEDAFRTEVVVYRTGWTALLALADGAGSTLFARDWAQALVSAVTDAWTAGDLHMGVEEVRAQFDPFADGQDPSDFMRIQKWNELGSAATLLVASVRAGAARARCNVACVGDSLLLVSQRDALTTFPLTRSSEFGQRTDAVHTHRLELNHHYWRRDLPGGSMLVLASDALARWLLLRHESDGARSVNAWLKSAVKSRIPAVDDDATLIVLELPA